MRMYKRFVAFLFTALSLVFALPIEAAQRTFVASTGSDANPCTFALPCRSFAAAIAVTDAFGEVIVKDSAGYGAVTITQSVALTAAPGVYAGLSVFPGADGITINASPFATVSLRGLTVNGQGGNNGIRVIQAETVHIENVVVSNMDQNGLLLEGGSAVNVVDSVIRSHGGNGIQVSGTGAVSIRNSVTRDNSANGVVINSDASLVIMEHSQSNDNTVNGILVTAGGLGFVQSTASGNGGNGLSIVESFGGDVGAAITASGFYGNESDGVFVLASTPGGTASVMIEGSTASGNGGNGYSAGATTGLSSLHISQSVASQNDANGVAADSAGSTVRVRSSRLLENILGAGMAQSSSAVLESCGDNWVSNNFAATSGTINAVICNQ